MYSITVNKNTVALQYVVYVEIPL